VRDGSVINATFYTHSPLLVTLDNYLTPFENYLQRILMCDDVALDHSNAYEWTRMILWRLQELLSTKVLPQSVLPTFFLLLY
jgi:hypothetical protein